MDTATALRIRDHWNRGSNGASSVRGGWDELSSLLGQNNTGVTWSATQSSADSVIRYNLQQLRDKSRVLETANPTAERIFHLWEANVLSSEGFTLQMQVKQDRDVTLAGGKVIKKGAPDAGANSALENAWYDFWRTRGHCDASGELSGLDMEKLVFRGAARDGVPLIRLIRGFNNAWRFALQPLEIDQLDLNYNEVLPNGNEIRMSIEVDKWGHRVAAHVALYEPGDWQRSYFGSARSFRNRIRIPFEGFQTKYDDPNLGTILAPMRKRRAGQTLDLPWLTPVIDVINCLAKAEEAELTAARAEAEKLGFLKASVNAEGEGFTGVKPGSATHRALDSVPGSIQALDPGWEFQGWDPKHPNGNFGEFRKMLMRSIASGVGMSYGAVANDRSDSSFSAERTALNDEREEYKMLQRWFSDQFLQPVFSAWLQMALASGKVTLANGSPLPLARFEKFDQPFFQGRRWGYINPLQDAQAYSMLRDRGWMSDSQIAAEGGRYLEDVYAEIRADMALAEGAEDEEPLVFGLAATTMPDRQTPEKKPKPDKPEE